MKNIKLLLICSLLAPQIVLAQQSTTNPNSSSSSSAKTTEIIPDTAKETQAKADVESYRTATKAADKLIKIKASGEKYIDARLTVLNKLLTQIDNSSANEETKTKLKASITAEINALTSLKTTLANEMDLERAKTILKNIFSQHRTYRIFVPKQHGLLITARLQQSYTRMVSLEAKISTFLTTAKTEGKDTSAAELAFTDYQAQLVVLKTALSLAEEKFTAMAIGDDAAAKINLDAGKEALATAKTALTNIKADLEEFAKLK